MQLPLQIDYHQITKSEAVDQFIRDKAAHMEKFCDHISHCNVVIEQPNKAQQSGSPYRVRIDVTVPPHHELVADERQGQHDMHEPLTKVINDAFKSMERQLRDLVDKQQHRVKTHTGDGGYALVTKLFPDLGYGFITAPDNREVYFHRNSLVGVAFEELKVGAEVRYEEAPGEQGPHATTVHVVSSGQPRI